MKSGPMAKIGTGAREGRTPHTKSLSVSRSIQHGIDWTVPVMVQLKKVAVGGEAMTAGAGTAGDNPNQAASTAAQGGGREAQGLAAESSWEDTVARLYTVSELQRKLPAPVGGKPPQPPAAVARSIRRDVEGAPSDWDWQKLGHNYRSCFTTSGGGAYSHGVFIGRQGEVSGGTT